MEDADDLNTWETRRQKLIEYLSIPNISLDLKTIMKELEYPNKHVLIDDIASIAKTLKAKGLKLIVLHPSCIGCGYIFRQNKDSFKIPSKCPKCREERIKWPSIAIKIK